MGRNVTLQTLWQSGFIPAVTDRLGLSYFVIEHLPMDWTLEIPDDLCAELPLDGPPNPN